MVSAKAMHFGDVKTACLYRLAKDEHPAAVQIFGREPELMAEAAATLLALDDPPDAIDINMGCPMPKITSNGEGSALMREPQLAGRIVEAVARASFPAPVTVKFRSGWDENHINAVELAKIAEQSGAAALTVHGRTRSQLYAPPVDLEIIAEVKRAVSIPVIGNGGIQSADDAINMLRVTGCDGIAVARGAQGRPWIFAEISAAISNDADVYIEPDLNEKLDVAITHMKMCCEDKGRRGVLESRGQLAHYIKGLPGAAVARDAINRANSSDELAEILEKVRCGT
jgi:nifR3 family TIM-barrel protein